MLPSDLNAIEFEHITGLIGQEENERLEFKQPNLKEDGTWDRQPHKTEKDDQPTQILLEILSFANQDGGDLILGLSEEESDGDGGMRASDVVKIADASKVASDLENKIGSSFDPPLWGIRCRAILDNDGKGVIVVRVPQSSNAPHALKEHRKSRLRIYRRNGHQKIPMTMRDVHDAVRLRDLGEIAKQKRFDDLLSLTANPLARPAGFRFTAIPRTYFDLSREAFGSLDHDFPNPQPYGISPPLGEPRSSYIFPFNSLSWRPMYGGKRTDLKNDHGILEERLYRDGTIWLRYDPDNWEPVDPEHVVAFMVVVLVRVEQFRRFFSVPSYPYEIKISITCPATSDRRRERFLNLGGRQDSMAAVLPRDFCKIGPYEYENTAEFSGLLTEFERDLWDLVGVPRRQLLEIDASEVLGRLNLS